LSLTRVLQVIDGLRIGGAETVLLGLLQLTDHDRFPTYVASVGPNDQEFIERIRAVSPGVFAVTGRALWDPRPVLALASIIRREQIDMVQTHLPGADIQGGLAAWLTGLPVVSVMHSVAEDRTSYGRSRRILADFATRHLANRVVAVSEAAKESHVTELGIAPDRFVVLPNVPVSAYQLGHDFDRSQKRRALGVGDSLVISVASRLVESKDHDTFLRSLPNVVAEHPRVRVFLLGDGPLREHLVALCSDLGLNDNVVFAGYRLDAVEIVAASDVFCHPTFYEGFGLALAEAMALGVAVVATGVPGVLELVDDGQTGLLVPPQNPVALAQALNELLADPDRRRLLGRAAQESVRSRYDPDAWVAAVQQVYVEAVAAQPRRRRWRASRRDS
jgi:glycosyltransferase involved in cell wall biosynthesis